MADYGHDLSFGIFVTPAADAAGQILQLARRADEAGLDWVSVQDHPYQSAFLDAWTLLTDALLSHLSYEEHQLLAPLARFGPAIYDR